MKSNHKKNIFIRIITKPYRIICKAKDLYIRTITDCSNNLNYDGMAPVTYRTTSTSSFAASDATAEDLRELIRANSTARMGDLDVTRADVEVYVKKHVMTVGSRRVGRSVSVGMGKIDEDVPVSGFPDVGEKNIGSLMFPRSRSHAVISKSNKLNRFS